MIRLKSHYEKEVKPILIKEFGEKNELSCPKIDKVIINAGVGDTLKDKGALEKAMEDLATITGQKASVRKARVSVASFGVRKGMAVGLKVTLRGARMYIFLDKLVSIVLPRLRDFRGLSRKSFDNSGNYSIGLTEHTVFPEIDLAKSTPRSLEVTIVTSTNDNKKSKRLLELIGVPFEKT